MPKNSKEPLYRKALALNENILGPHHPTVAQNLNDLASELKAQGKYSEAGFLYYKALSIREKALGPEHIDVSQNLNNIAGLLCAQGRFIEAEPLCRRSLAIRKKVFGIEDSDSVISLLNLAKVLGARKKYKEAESLYREALAVQEKLLGLKHPSLLKGFNNLASLLELQGKNKEAKHLRHRALNLRKKSRKDDLEKTQKEQQSSILNRRVTLENKKEAKHLRHRALNLRKKSRKDDLEKTQKKQQSSILNKRATLGNEYDPVNILLSVLTPKRRNFFLLIALYPLMLFLAELHTAGFGVGYMLGLWLHTFTLIVIIFYSVLEDDERHEILLALAVLPIIRLLSFAMPLWLVDQVYSFPLVNLPLIVSTLTVIGVLGYTRQELGLTLKHWYWQIFIILSAALIGYIERLIIQPPALAESLTFEHLIIPALSLLIFTGLSEELLFRGVLQNAAIKNWGPYFGILYVSILFGVLHIGWNSFLDVVYVTLVGLIWGIFAYKTGSIVGTIFAHGIANIMLFIVLPLLGI